MKEEWGKEEWLGSTGPQPENRYAQKIFRCWKAYQNSPAFLYIPQGVWVIADSKKILAIAPNKREAFKLLESYSNARTFPSSPRAAKTAHSSPMPGYDYLQQFPC